MATILTASSMTILGTALTVRKDILLKIEPVQRSAYIARPSILSMGIVSPATMATDWVNLVYAFSKTENFTSIFNLYIIY